MNTRMDVVTDDISGFFDLNISSSVQSGTKLQNVLDRAAMLGYTTVAVNVTVNLDELESVTSKKKKIRKGARAADTPLTDGFPDPNEIQFSAPVCSGTGRKLRVLKRVTLAFSGQGDMSRIGRSTNLKRFDLLAVQPITQAAFNLACQTLPIDIISIDPLSFRGFMLSRKLSGLASRRGIALELVYAPALSAGAGRRQLLLTALTVTNVTGGKNVLVSSGANHEHQLRGPYDVPSVAQLMGLSAAAAKASVSSLPKSTVTHAVGRNCTGFCMAQLVPVPEAGAEQTTAGAAPAGKRRRTTT
ncbi:ribonuclease P protein subunit p30-like isoform X1 [Pollicipes pollicipes]|uniref:ribonuclease P protein subunit p30-like isoform X1 n=1 Tax=Pollicipes pollicipes TaxID=41117 RepID=UPI001884C51D|nr:ribonuclease P protein subunit p30-like isoform X1 [Pollicipes pollicipes]XP_037069379.1 ribonuclease P protein subunit p30-like isoform X1 [Pollicipes pollicipes]XP_037069380.1 ribonuclease P protein subunit p30-like isoform X1 [Pollicipes pollicipes]